MAIAYGGRAGSNHGNTTGAVETVTTTANIPAGAAIVVSVSGSNVGDTSNLTSVTDSAGNTYVSGGFSCDAGQNTLTAVWYSLTGNALASGGTVTVTFHAALLSSGESWEITVDYLTGAATSSATDGTNNHNSQTGATWDTNSITTTNANDLLWVAAGTNQGAPVTLTNGASLPASGWTTLAAVSGGAGNNNQLSSAYQVVGATGTYKGGGTASAGNNGTSAVIVAFKEAAGGGGTPISASDTGTGADAVTISATIPVTDTGTGTDAASLTANFTKADTGTGADAASLVASFTKADTGAGVDTVASLVVSFTVADSGTGADSVTTGTPLTVADSGTGVDSVALQAVIAKADSGIGADVLASLVVSFLIADSGTGADSVIVAGSVIPGSAANAANGPSAGLSASGTPSATLTAKAGGSAALSAAIAEP